MKMLSGNIKYIFFQISAALTGVCANMDVTLLVGQSKLIQTNLTEGYVELFMKELVRLMKSSTLGLGLTLMV